MKNLAKPRTIDLVAAPASDFSVDPATGTLKNVALLTVGPTIDGRFYIDQETLTTGLAAIEKRGGRVRIYPSHNHSGMPKSWKESKPDEATAELNFAAFVEKVVVRKKQLIGGALEFYDTFKTEYAPIYNQIAELAVKTPDLLGLSLEPIFHLVYVDKKGVEYSAWPEKADLAYDGLPVMRIDDVFTGAFGSVVAANPGLFAKLTAKFGGKRTRQVAHLVAEMLTELRADLTPSAPAKTSEGEAKDTSVPLMTPPAPETFSLMKIIADLSAKFGNDDARLSRALLIVSKTPAADQAALTIAAVEAQLQTGDLTAANVRVTQLTTDLAAANTKATTDLTAANLEITNLKKQVTDLTAESAKKVTDLTAASAEWERKFNAIKSSGLLKGIDLGAESSGSGGSDDNPFLTADLTAQSLLFQKDPVRAASLQSAALVARAAAKK